MSEVKTFVLSAREKELQKENEELKNQSRFSGKLCIFSRQTGSDSSEKQIWVYFQREKI